MKLDIEKILQIAGRCHIWGITGWITKQGSTIYKCYPLSKTAEFAEDHYDEANLIFILVTSIDTRQSIEIKVKPEYVFYESNG